MVGAVGADGSNPGGLTTARRRAIVAACLGAGLLAGVAPAMAGLVTPPATLGKTTLEQRIVADGAPGYRQLALGAGEGAHVVREEGVGTAGAGRESRRVALAYFSQLSDFQLADEESPARVEFLDPDGPPFDSAFRPWEALEPHIDDAMIRQVNAFAAAAPVADGSGARPVMDFSINTGDSADSQQLNETRWVKELIEGGTIDPNSGVDPAGYEHELCDTVPAPGAAEAPLYTGVQDHADYANAAFEDYFYDPVSPTGGPFAAFPTHPGLMDRGQESFEAAGLEVPSYLAFGNHDALVQGSVGGKPPLEQAALGCIKPLDARFPDGSHLFTGFDAQDLLDLYADRPEDTILVPPDPDRRFVSKARYKDVFINGDQADGHGFGLVDPAEDSASRRAAGYYSFSPVPGLRMIALDTVSEGGSIANASSGNLDDPQFRWLETELQSATAADELVIVFSHHAPASMTANTVDEHAPACTSVEPEAAPTGCDLDPRDSSPIHLGDDVIALLHRYPHAVGWVAGHSHTNRVQPFVRPDGGGFWVIRVAAEADWPQQARLLQLFDNRDGTLSLFGTIVDHAAPATAADTGTSAASMEPGELASIARTLAYNDPQSGARACGARPCGEGDPADRNVELLVADPRGRLAPGRCANAQRGTARRDVLLGTEAGDRLRGRGGRDRLVGRGGRDCLAGGAGKDKLVAGDDKDRLSGGSGDDKLKARDGKRDTLRCGGGDRDRAVVDRKDRVRGCERVKRRR
jgi:metallophosphoesterase (TIGR03767 family)